MGPRGTTTRVLVSRFLGQTDSSSLNSPTPPPLLLDQTLDSPYCRADITADREITAAENQDAFRNYYFRPRVLRDVTTGSTETEFMGIKSTLPIFISPAAMAKLGHPLGEVNLTKGAGECGIVQGVCLFTSTHPNYPVVLLLMVDLYQR